MTRSAWVGWAASLSVALAPAAAETGRAATDRLRFAVFLNDREIGYHDFRFRELDGARTVESEASFDVKLLFINAFRYRHQHVERWSDDGCLVEISARTDNNGKDLAVRGAARDDLFIVDGSAGTAELTGCVRSFAYWNPKVREARRLLNSQTGEYLDVEVTRLGRGTITVGGEVTTVDRLRLTAKDTDIEICYDAATGTWVALDSQLKKGRVLSYRLVSSNPATA